MIDSESRESRIRIPARGNGVTALRGPVPRFRWMLYEGGEALPSRALRLDGSDCTGGKEKRPWGPKGYQRI